jgi:hypothetical protein
MLTLFRRLIDNIRGQRGQVVVVAVGVMALGLGAIMISVDVGWWLRDKRDAQNDADAIALAAVQEIGDPSQRGQAVAAGLDWADFNGVDTSEVVEPDCTDGVVESNFCFIDRDDPPDGIDDMVRVKVSRPSNSFIATALGVSSPTLSPPAAAAKVRAYGACVLPWAIDAHPDFEDPESYEDVWGVLGDPPNPEQLFVFQLSPGGGFAGDDTAPGNFGALGVYGANDADYTDTIINECGSQGQSACNSDSQVVSPDDPTLDCDIQTGNLGATTNKALTERAERYGEVYPYRDCDASSYGEAVNNADSCEGRLVVLAIIKDFPKSGSDTVEIYGIANFYIAGWDRCAPFNDSDDCGEPKPADSGIAWGYLLLEELGGTPAWKFDFSQSSNNPFAPVIVALVE